MPNPSSSARTEPAAADQVTALAAWSASISAGDEGRASAPRFAVVTTGTPSALVSDLVADLAADLSIDVVAAGMSFASGSQAADCLADAGVTAIVVIADADPVAAWALCGLLTRANAAEVTAPQADDADWMRQCAAVRDRMQEARGALGDRDALLTAIGDPGITAAAGVIDAASRRGVGIVLDTASTLAAALVVERSERRLSRTWLAGTRSDEPAQHRAIDRLELQPVVPLGSRRVGVGGLAAVPVIRAAVRAAAQEEPQH